MLKKDRKVVVTGTGVVSPLGTDTEEFWESLVNKKTRFSPPEIEGVSYVARAPGGWDQGFPVRVKRHTDRVTRMALHATREALETSELLDSPKMLHTTGLFMGSSIGGVQTLAEEFGDAALHGVERMTPLAIPKSLMNMMAANMSIQFGLRGEALTYASACASGSVAIGAAYRAIRSGDLDVAVAGGAEACVIDQVLEPFRKLGAMSSATDPDSASIPFSRHRSGFVMAEGAGILVLEELEHARGRGATIIGEVVGYHGTSDGRSLLAPDLDGISRAMSGLFAPSGEHEASKVTYINAHGTSTRINDVTEAQAIASLFPHRPLVSSTKSYYGHPLGAAGALEAIVSLLTLREGIALPTLNVEKEDVDPEIDLNLVLKDPLPLPPGLVMSNSFAFGGQNAALLLGRCP